MFIAVIVFSNLLVVILVEMYTHIIVKSKFNARIRRYPYILMYLKILGGNRIRAGCTCMVRGMHQNNTENLS